MVKTSNLLILQVVICLLFSCISQNSKKMDTFKANEGGAVFAIDPKIHNFGKIESGEIVSFSFGIENLGNVNLIIDSIDGGCGCIETKLTTDLIEPSQKSYLEIKFNSSGEWGNILKPVIVFSNAESDTIYITAQVSNKLFN